MGMLEIKKQSKTYETWHALLQRCNNPKNIGYEYYDKRRISVCDRWLKFENFLKDMGLRPEGLTIDRKDNDGNYEPGNCRWATRKEQCRNNRGTKLSVLKVQVIKKLLKESRLTQKDIAEIFNVVPATINAINIGKTWVDI